MFYKKAVKFYFCEFLNKSKGIINNLSIIVLPSIKLQNFSLFKHFIRHLIELSIHLLQSSDVIYLQALAILKTKLSSLSKNYLHTIRRH
jgi:hypothetical protein